MKISENTQYIFFMVKIFILFSLLYVPINLLSSSDQVKSDIHRSSVITTPAHKLHQHWVSPSYPIIQS